MEEGERNMEESNEIFTFAYDQFYRQLGEKINQQEEKTQMEIVRNKARKELQKKLQLDQINLDPEEVKTHFLSYLNKPNSYAYLWLFNSKYSNENFQTNILDLISPIFQQSNQQTKEGINVYKANGWMTHSLYVYQLVNNNIANGVMIRNFAPNEQMWLEKELLLWHKLYWQLTETTRFVLKILTLIHDIGVVKNVKEHAKWGEKFVDQVLQDIGITDKFLQEEKITLSLQNLSTILKQMIKYHVIYSDLSGEGSDAFVEKRFQTFLAEIKSTGIDAKEISSALYLFTIADVIAVNEKIFNQAKQKNLKNTYQFFQEIIDNKPHHRNKKQVAAERLCDMIGENELEKVKQQAEQIMMNKMIDSSLFWTRLYDCQHFFHVTAIIKQIKNLDVVITLFNDLMSGIIQKQGEESLKHITITWIPNHTEKEAVKRIVNNCLAETIEKWKNSSQEEMIWQNNRITLLTKEENELELEIEILV